jgi:xanthine/CO dehydrogenase XdhC/CoxF family maturation factor
LGGDGVLTAGDPGLAAAVRPVLSAALRDRAATPFRAVLPGLAELLVEPVPEPVTLLLAGSGEEIAALARIAAELGWDVEVVLPRVPAAIESRVAVISGGPVRSAGDLSFLISRRTAIVVATHNYLDDLDVLRSVLATSAAYVGVLGSRGRVDRLCADAAVAGDVSRIRGPAGLDVGAETPGEIALSIAAEIQAVLCGRDGGPLRAAGGAIHARAPGESEPAWAIGAQP